MTAGEHRGGTFEVPVTVEIEQTAESLHAHAVPEGIMLRPGDTVVVHGAPSGIAFGQSMIASASMPERSTSPQ